jgi:nucleoside 2-deoxyribosyltransferase
MTLLRRLRVYVAGPISNGDRLANINRAVEMGVQMFRDGLAPFVPHFDAYWFLPEDEQVYEGFLEFDFAFIEVCDAVFRLPGFSPGADREVAFAAEHGIPVFSIYDVLLHWALDTNPGGPTR